MTEITETKNEAQGPQTIAYHAILVEVLESGDMRVRIDNGFLSDPPKTATVRPSTGCEPVSPEICFAQVEESAQILLRMMREVYPA